MGETGLGAIEAMSDLAMVSRASESRLGRTSIESLLSAMMRPVTVRPLLSVMSVFWYWSLSVLLGSTSETAMSSSEKRRETPESSGPPLPPMPPARWHWAHCAAR